MTKMYRRRGGHIDRFISKQEWQRSLFYLPTQIRFLIGGECVTCHWSKLQDALGRTKLHDAPGQQQLELSTRMWSGRALLKPRQICLPATSSKYFFTQSWQVNGFKQELKKKLSSRENMTFQRSLNICDLINSYVFVTYFMCKLRYWDL